MSAHTDASHDDPLLTADEVADLLSVSKAWVYEQSRQNRIPTVTLGRYRRYRRSSVLQWVAELEGGPLASPRVTS